MGRHDKPFSQRKGSGAENDPLRAAKPGVLSGFRIASPLRVIEMVDTRIACRIAECRLYESAL
jgi:hypothetical protein